MIYAIIKGSLVILINYYAPNQENGQIQVLNEIQEHLGNLDLDQGTQLICGGDLDIILQSYKLSAENDMCNIYGTRCPFSKCYTCRQKLLLSSLNWTTFLFLIICRNK